MKRWLAILAGVLVTILWSTSYILNVYAFAEGIKPLTLAGLRYTVAVIVLWLFSNLRNHYKKSSTIFKEGKGELSLSLWHYLLLGLTGFIMAQGLQYLGQFHVTPTQTSLILNIGNVSLVLLIDALWLRESQTRGSILAMSFVVFGVLIYYYPWNLAYENILGIMFILLSSVGYAIQLTMTRYFISQKGAQPEELVMKGMFFGAIGMVILGIGIEGIPVVTVKVLGILVWLGSINGAFAFYLWAWSQKQLQAFESCILNNLMLLEVTFLDIILLGRVLSPLQVIGLIVVGITVAYVQIAPGLQSRRLQKLSFKS